METIDLESAPSAKFLVSNDFGYSLVGWPKCILEFSLKKIKENQLK